MRWAPGGRSSNIEDRRGGGGLGLGWLGIGGGVIALALSATAFRSPRLRRYYAMGEGAEVSPG